MLRVSSRVAVRVAVLTAFFVTFFVMDSFERVFFPVTVFATCVPIAAVTLVMTAPSILLKMDFLRLDAFSTFSPVSAFVPFGA